MDASICDGARVSITRCLDCLAADSLAAKDSGTGRGVDLICVPASRRAAVRRGDILLGCVGRDALLKEPEDPPLLTAAFRPATPLGPRRLMFLVVEALGLRVERAVE